MVSLLFDVVFCIVLVTGAYFLFGSPNRPGSSVSAKKKKKSKAKSKTAPSPAVSGIQAGVAKEASKAEVVAETLASPLKIRSNGNPSTAFTQPAKPTRDSLDQEDYPPLSASAKPQQSKKLRAERLAKPLPRIGPEDMIDPEVHAPKAISHTMRIVKPHRGPQTIIDHAASGGEEDNSPMEEETLGLDGRLHEADEEWEKVPVTSQKKSATMRLTSSPISSGGATQARSIPGLTEPSKKQRQNAARVAAAKEAKDAAEHERLARLAAHKRGLERDRVNTQARDREKNKERQPTRSSRQLLSGGQTAKVSESGALIWD